jgi:hypothetical protein
MIKIVFGLLGFVMFIFNSALPPELFLVSKVKLISMFSKLSKQVRSTAQFFRFCKR